MKHKKCETCPVEHLCLVACDEVNEDLCATDDALKAIGK